MTLIYEFDLDVLKMYLRTKNEVFRFWEVRAQTSQSDTHAQTDRCDRMHY